MQGINTLLPEIMTETTTTRDNNTGEQTTETTQKCPNGDLHAWLPIALNEMLWNHHIAKLQQPGIYIPPRDPSRHCQNHAYNQTEDDQHNDDDNNNNNDDKNNN